MVFRALIYFVGVGIILLMDTAPCLMASSSKLLNDEMIFINGDTFLMGTNDGFPYEGPVHKVTVKSFWIDRHEVTVVEFTKFIETTGYQTEAERYGWSGVFDIKSGEWKKMDGADWRHPDGLQSLAALDEPVTQVSWNDAIAYAKWKKKRLPTEEEWEYAARGGLKGKKYAWGDELYPRGKHLANVWQGIFPEENKGADGYLSRALVCKFPPNGYGLYDMIGNVWEWCADWFIKGYESELDLKKNDSKKGGERVIRGGSWMCSENYCTGYRVAARSHSAPDSGLNHLGFRCAKDK